MSTSSTDSAYRLSIRMAAIEPPIWRQIVVSGNITLFHLHQVLQVVMGWENYHLHQFWVSDKRYGTPDPEYELDIKNDRLVRLRTIARKPVSYTHLTLPTILRV